MKVNPEKVLADFGVRAVPTDDRRRTVLQATRRKPARSKRAADTMTAADWDKFERDIAEVFERVP